MGSDHGTIGEANLERTTGDACSDVIEQGLTIFSCTIHVASTGWIMEEQVDHNAVWRVGLDLQERGESEPQ